MSISYYDEPKVQRLLAWFAAHGDWGEFDAKSHFHDVYPAALNFGSTDGMVAYTIETIETLNKAVEEGILHSAGQSRFCATPETQSRFLSGLNFWQKLRCQIGILPLTGREM